MFYLWFVRCIKQRGPSWCTLNLQEKCIWEVLFFCVLFRLVSLQKLKYTLSMLLLSFCACRVPPGLEVMKLIHQDACRQSCVFCSLTFLIVGTWYKHMMLYSRRWKKTEWVIFAYRIRISWTFRSSVSLCGSHFGNWWVMWNVSNYLK